MSMPTAIETLYQHLKTSLKGLIDERDLAGQNLSVHCRILEVAEAIGFPEHQDYPIQQGREYMVEARFQNARGQAFADQFENHEGVVESLLTMAVDTSARRAIFIAGLNAVYRHCGLCESTVHCRDEEPVACARKLHGIFPENTKILLVGLQPRFLEALAQAHPLRVIDLDPKNIGTRRCGIEIEAAEATDDAIAWCDGVLATGSTIVNGSILRFLGLDKQVVFFGVTISAAATVLGLDTYCHASVR